MVSPASEPYCHRPSATRRRCPPGDQSIKPMLLPSASADGFNSNTMRNSADSATNNFEMFWHCGIEASVVSDAVASLSAYARKRWSAETSTAVLDLREPISFPVDW